MELFNDGKFVGKFNADSNKAKDCTRRAKQKPLLESKDDFKQAYKLYSDLEHEISKFESRGAALQPRATSIFLTIVKMGLSVAVSVGVAYCFSSCSL